MKNKDKGRLDQKAVAEKFLSNVVQSQETIERVENDDLKTLESNTKTDAAVNDNTTDIIESKLQTKQNNTSKIKELQRCYYLPDETHREVKVRALIEGVSNSDIVFVALKEYFERHKRGDF